MTLRQKIAIAMFLIGLLLVFGAAGQADCSMIWGTEFYVRSGIGLALICVSLPVSGELDGEDN